MKNVLRLFLVLCIALAGTAALAQDTLTKGSIGGVVTDSNGGILPNAKVTVEGQQTSITTQTNDQGLYKVDNLLPGTYTVTVEQAGFKKQVSKGVIVYVGKESTVNPKLEAGNISEVVTVTDTGGIDHPGRHRRIRPRGVRAGHRCWPRLGRTAIGRWRSSRHDGRTGRHRNCRRHAGVEQRTSGRPRVRRRDQGRRFAHRHGRRRPRGRRHARCCSRHRRSTRVEHGRRCHGSGPRCLPTGRSARLSHRRATIERR